MFGFINLCSGNTRSNSSIFWYSFSSYFIYLVDLCYTFEYCIFFKWDFVCLAGIHYYVGFVLLFIFLIIDLIRFSFFHKEFFVSKEFFYAPLKLSTACKWLKKIFSIIILCISVLFQIRSAAWEWFIIFPVTILCISVLFQSWICCQRIQRFFWKLHKKADNFIFI